MPAPLTPPPTTIRSNWPRSRVIPYGSGSTRIKGTFPCQVSANFLSGGCGGDFYGLYRCAGDMRSQSDVIELKQFQVGGRRLDREGFYGGAAQMPRLERLRERVVVDHRPPRRVHEI